MCGSRDTFSRTETKFFAGGTQFEPGMLREVTEVQFARLFPTRSDGYTKKGGAKRVPLDERARWTEAKWRELYTRRAEGALDPTRKWGQAEAAEIRKVGIDAWVRAKLDELVSDQPPIGISSQRFLVTNSSPPQAIDRIVKWEQTATPTTCGARCRMARGPMCDCVCEGRFHGAGVAMSRKTIAKRLDRSALAEIERIGEDYGERAFRRGVKGYREDSQAQAAFRMWSQKNAPVKTDPSGIPDNSQSTKAFVAFTNAWNRGWVDAHEWIVTNPPRFGVGDLVGWHNGARVVRGSVLRVNPYAKPEPEYVVELHDSARGAIKQNLAQSSLQRMARARFAEGFKGFVDPWAAMAPEDRREAGRLSIAALKAMPSSPRQNEIRAKLNAILAKYGLDKPPEQRNKGINMKTSGGKARMMQFSDPIQDARYKLSDAWKRGRMNFLLPETAQRYKELATLALARPDTGMSHWNAHEVLDYVREFEAWSAKNKKEKAAIDAINALRMEMNAIERNAQTSSGRVILTPADEKKLKALGVKKAKLMQAFIQKFGINHWGDEARFSRVAKMARELVGSRGSKRVYLAGPDGGGKFNLYFVQVSSTGVPGEGAAEDLIEMKQFATEAKARSAAQKMLADRVGAKAAFASANETAVHSFGDGWEVVQRHSGYTGKDELVLQRRPAAGFQPVIVKSIADAKAKHDAITNWVFRATIAEKSPGAWVIRATAADGGYTLGGRGGVPFPTEQKAAEELKKMQANYRRKAGMARNSAKALFGPTWKNLKVGDWVDVYRDGQHIAYGPIVWISNLRMVVATGSSTGGEVAVKATDEVKLVRAGTAAQLRAAGFKTWESRDGAKAAFAHSDIIVRSDAQYDYYYPEDDDRATYADEEKDGVFVVKSNKTGGPVGAKRFPTWETAVAASNAINEKLPPLKRRRMAHARPGAKTLNAFDPFNAPALPSNWDGKSITLNGRQYRVVASAGGFDLYDLNSGKKAKTVTKDQLDKAWSGGKIRDVFGRTGAKAAFAVTTYEDAEYRIALAEERIEKIRRALADRESWIRKANRLMDAAERGDEKARSEVMQIANLIDAASRNLPFSRTGAKAAFGTPDEALNVFTTLAEAEKASINGNRAKAKQLLQSIAALIARDRSKLPAGAVAFYEEMKAKVGMSRAGAKAAFAANNVDLWNFLAKSDFEIARQSPGELATLRNYAKKALTLPDFTPPAMAQHGPSLHMMAKEVLASIKAWEEAVTRRGNRAPWNMSRKIATLTREGYRRDQAVAIAHDMKRRGEI
jgi:hypothetical protein